MYFRQLVQTVILYLYRAFCIGITKFVFIYLFFLSKNRNKKLIVHFIWRRISISNSSQLIMSKEPSKSIASLLSIDCFEDVLL